MRYFKDDNIRKSIFTYTVTGIILMISYFIISDIQRFKDIFMNIISILRPFIVGGVIAFLLRAPMDIIETRLLNKLSMKDELRHLLAVILALIFGVFCVVVFFYILLPQLIESIVILFGNFEMYLNNLEQIILEICATLNIDATELLRMVGANIPPESEITAAVMNFVTTFLPNIFKTTINVANGTVQLFLGVIIAVYILLDIKGFTRECKRALYAFVNDDISDSIISIVHLSDQIFNDFIGGKILDSIIIGIIAFICMSILDWPFPLLVSVIIGVTNVIPFFGPFIGAVPGFLIVLVVSPKTSILFLIFILLLQQFDGNILGPKILGDTIGLPAIWIVFSILIGQGLFGFIGMVLGVPVFAVCYFLVKQRIDLNLQLKNKTIE